MRREKEATCIYVARGDGFTKIGVTRNAALRRYRLRSFNGMRFDLGRMWLHDDPYALEVMVLHAMRLDGVQSIGREVFAVGAADAARRIDSAIDAYRRLRLDRGTPPRELRDIARTWVATCSSRTLYDVLGVRRPNDPRAGGRGKIRGSR